MLQFDLGEAEPDVGIELTGLFMAVAREVENDDPASVAKDAIRGAHSFLRTRSMMERLAEERQIDAFVLDRRVLDITETIFKILLTVFAREIAAKLHHLLRVVDGDDFFCAPSEQLRKRAFAGAKVGDDHGRQKPQ